MEPKVLDITFAMVKVVDSFESFIWTDRYYGYGDFELMVPITSSIVAFLIKNYYLYLKESEHLMIIDHLDIHSDKESGNNKLIVTGKSLEFILNRRIIWNQTILSGNLQDGIHQLLDENAIVCTDNTDRIIPGLAFEVSTDPIITALTIDAQYNGDNLYDVIVKLCQTNNIGFKITLTDTNTFKFKLYAGLDRSYTQTTNPYVVFSSGFDNLLNGDYIETDQALKTVALVAGELGVGNVALTAAIAVAGGAGTGLARREMFVDAKDITRNVGEVALTPEEYLGQLTQRGTETLSKNVAVQSFAGQVDATHMFVYGDDFVMGDIVQIADDYGHNAKSRVTELIQSQDSAGIKVYPTFSTVDNSS